MVQPGYPPGRQDFVAAFPHGLTYAFRMSRVLVVDDAPDTSEPLQRFLAKSGYEVRCVANGREAMEAVLNDLPDVVVLDLLMPVMDGSTFLEVIRSYLRLQRTPVIVLTALADGPLIKRARAAKVSAILLKTKATYEDIKRAIEAALQPPHTMIAGSYPAGIQPL